MKNKFSFFIVGSTSGIQKYFSMNKYLLYLILLIVFLLLGSGIIGAWKYRENIAIEEKCMLLEAKKKQLKSAERTVDEIQEKESAIRQLLGLQDREDEGQEQQNNQGN